MAILDIPFAYQAEYVASRRRVPDRAWILDSVPVRVLEAAVSDAPAAATWGAPGTETVFRALGGRLLRPHRPGMGPPSMSGGGPPMSLEAARDDFASWSARARMTGIDAPWVSPEQSMAYDGNGWTLPCGAVARGEVAARVWLHDDRAARRAVLVRALDLGMALVGGVLHVPSSGPAWIAGAHGIRAMPEYGFAKKAFHVFRGDRKALALGHVALLREGDGHRWERPDVAGRIDILDAAPFASVPDEADAVRGVARLLSSGAYARHVTDCEPDTITLFAEARRIAAGPDCAAPTTAAAVLLRLERGMEAVLSRNSPGRERGNAAALLVGRLRAATSELGPVPGPGWP